MADPVLTGALIDLFRADAATVEQVHANVRGLLRSVKYGTAAHVAFWHEVNDAVRTVAGDESRRCEASGDRAAASVGRRRLRHAMEQMFEPEDVKRDAQAKEHEAWMQRRADRERRHATFRADRMARGLPAEPTTGEPEPAVLIHAVSAAVPSEEATVGLPLGHSRIGGVPDLPPGVAWPTVDGRKVPFVAQLNLAEFPAVHPQMPADGHLFAFVLADDEHRPSPAFVFLHRGPAASLVRADRPVDDDDVFFGEGEDGLYGCVPATATLSPDATEEPEDAALGYFFGEMQDYYGTPGESADYALADGDDWVVLMEIGSNSFADMEWSDSGSLYLLITRDALAGLDFSGVVAAVCST